MLGFTSKREGFKSEVKNITTDSEASSPPVITFVNCTGRWGTHILVAKLEFLIRTRRNIGGVEDTQGHLLED